MLLGVNDFDLDKGVAIGMKAGASLLSFFFSVGCGEGPNIWSKSKGGTVEALDEKESEEAAGAACLNEIDDR